MPLSSVADSLTAAESRLVAMTPDARFTAVLEGLGMLGVTQSPFFGRRGIMADGKVIAVFLDDSMAFKLGATTPEHAAALAIPDAELWHPGNKTVPFKDWVRVHVAQDREWGRLAEQALHHVRQKL
jgi:hypothetical protein